MELTAAQKQILEEVDAKLSEHFESYVLITKIEGQGNRGRNESIHATHSGGHFNAIGLLTAGRHYYLADESDAENE